MRRIHIHSDEALTRDLLHKARGAVLAAHPLVCRDAVILVGDGYGLDIEIVTLCETLEVPVQVVGTGRKPANNTSLRHYQRVICPRGLTREQRRDCRDAWIRSQATDVVELKTTADNHERVPIAIPVASW